mmetsp:Transcript_6668/g.14204  ORF Transcript_6668/g.14204 Transcript_6668/m.14204 type:complete len:228 (+) Transcript_6668:154-837(+)
MVTLNFLVMFAQRGSDGAFPFQGWKFLQFALHLFLDSRQTFYRRRQRSLAAAVGTINLSRRRRRRIFVIPQIDRSVLFERNRDVRGGDHFELSGGSGRVPGAEFDEGHGCFRFGGRRLGDGRGFRLGCCHALLLWPSWRFCQHVVLAVVGRNYIIIIIIIIPSHGQNLPRPSNILAKRLHGQNRKRLLQLHGQFIHAEQKETQHRTRRQYRPLLSRRGERRIQGTRE